MKRFYPDYLIEILFFVFVVIELTLALTLLMPPVIGREIDFISPYEPRPEWYYLWLFMLLRYFYGPLAVLGGVFLPFLFIAILIFIPWIDKYMGRIVASVLIVLLCLFFVLSIFLA